MLAVQLNVVGDFFADNWEPVANALLNIVIAVVMWYVGTWAIEKIGEFLDAALERKQDLDPTIAGFIKSFVTGAAKFFLFIIVSGQVGIENSQFVVLGAAAFLAIAFAMEDTLANFAAGVLMLAFKPIEVGDDVTIGGEEGTVERIEMFNTLLLAEDGSLITVPNSSVTTEVIANRTRPGKLRCEVKLPIAPKADFRLAQSIVMEIMQDDERVLKDPAPRVVVETWDLDHTLLLAWCWTTPDDEEDVRYDIADAAKVAFDAAELLDFPSDSESTDSDDDDNVIPHGVRGLKRRDEREDTVKHGINRQRDDQDKNGQGVAVATYALVQTGGDLWG